MIEAKLNKKQEESHLTHADGFLFLIIFKFYVKI